MCKEEKKQKRKVNLIGIIFVCFVTILCILVARIPAPAAPAEASTKEPVVLPENFKNYDGFFSVEGSRKVPEKFIGVPFDCDEDGKDEIVLLMFDRAAAVFNESCVMWYILERDGRGGLKRRTP